MFDIKMRIVDIDAKIIRDLRQSGLSAKMKSFEFCKFLVIEEDKEKIIGAAGIGGFFNIQSLQVLDEYQGKGIGKKLFVKLLEEEKIRSFSYSLGSRNPQNTPMVKLGDLTNRYVLFRIHYAQGITRDVNIVVLRKRGKIVAKFLSGFNNLLGMIILAFTLKIIRRLFGTFSSYSREEFPEPNIKYMISNFEKISTVKNNMQKKVL